MSFKVLALFVAVAAASCNITDYVGWDSPEYHETAQAWTSVGVSVCGPQSGLTCCSNSVFHVIRTRYNFMKGVIDLQASWLDLTWGAYARMILLHWEDWNVSSLFSDAQAAEERKAALSAFAEYFPEQYGDCMKGLLEYVLGICCLGCNDNWDDYISADDTHIVLRIADRTCDAIVDACYPMVKTVTDLQHLKADLPGIVHPEPWCDTEADCKEKICQRVVQGAVINLSFNETTAKRQTSLDVVNEYSPTGYDAVVVGASSPLSLAPALQIGLLPVILAALCTVLLKWF